MTQRDQTDSDESTVELLERIGSRISRRSLLASSVAAGGSALALTAFGDEAHRDVLSAAVDQLGGTPARGLQFSFPYESFEDFVNLGAEIKALGIQAYAGAAPSIRTKLLLKPALSIHSAKARQAAYLQTLAGESPVARAFDDPMSMDSVVARASQFIDGLNDDRQLFAVTIENVSDEDTLDTPEGSMPVALSPGVYAVHEGGNPLYTPYTDASEGLERLAEDGFPSELVPEMETSLLTELARDDTVVEMGTFQSMDGGLPVLGAGEKTTFYITAAGNQDLSIATMFAPSNDLFLGPDLTGDYDIELFRNGNMVSRDVLGDVTDQILLYDAGTEKNQQPGIGNETKMKQSLTAIDVGAAESAPVRPAEEVDDGCEYPAVSDMIRVTIKPIKADEPSPC